MPPRTRSSSAAKKTKKTKRTSSSSSSPRQTVKSRQIRKTQDPSNNSNDDKPSSSLLVVAKDPIYGRFPPQADADGYFRYRRGRVNPMHRTFNTFILIPLIFIAMGNGLFMNMFVMVLNFFLKNNEKFGFSIDFANPLHCAVFMLTGMIFTPIAYYLACRNMEKQYYDSEETRKNSEEWKCKPYMWLTEDLRRQEYIWGCVNAALGSFYGISFFVYQQQPTTKPGTVKIYYDLQDPLYASWGTQYFGGWLTYALTIVAYFLLTDLWAYLSHRMLHWPLIYPIIHKFHHSFKAVSPAGAYALSIPEFTLIALGFQSIVLFLPMHFSALAVNLVYIGYHSIHDHAGIDLDGFFNFSPSSMYHDDHHTHFHCNFGQSLVFWDWLFGTLRNKNKKYGVKNFHD